MGRPRTIDREAVLRCVAEGMPRREIAAALGITIRSVSRIAPRHPHCLLRKRELADRIVAARLGWPGLWSREAVCLLAIEQHPVAWATADEVAVGVEGLLERLDRPAPLDLGGRVDVPTVEALLDGLVRQRYVARVGGERTRSKYLLSKRAERELRRRARQSQTRGPVVPTVRCHADGE